nr:TolC family protein [Pseudopedobacter sp.]
MKKSRLVFFVILLFSVSNVFAQEVTDTLTWNSFVEIIKQYHPLTVKAKLLVDLAKAKKRQAWGGFDPKLEADFDRKIYNGTEYYSFLTPQLKLPLWYGIELKGSYSEAEGAFLNPENKLPKEGLSYAGINFQLGKGLLMDSRRAAFKQAQIFEDASANEQVRILNDLFYEAGDSYINWQNKSANLKIFQNALNLSKVRFDAVKSGFFNGDKPAIDTIEAQLQVQQREISFQQAQLELKQAEYGLSTFLWLENSTPVDADALNIKPQDEGILAILTSNDIKSNPKLLSYDFKIKDLNIERRLKAESLKPELNIGLGLLNQGRTPFRNINSTYWNQNNKVNVSFAIPLTFSKARGDIAEAKIKIRQVELDRDLMRNELDIKMKQNIAEVTTLQNQLNILKTTLSNSEALLKGEETKFKFGDSSLFLINSRETKLIEVQEKLFLVEAKLNKVQIKSLWLTGGLFENL